MLILVSPSAVITSYGLSSAYWISKLLLGSWLAFLAAGYPPLDALFEVVSATATVGLSVGITGPDLEPGLKLLLSLNMLAGRLEIVALLVLLFPWTWYKP
jgi:trk system potassium uptake protein TrkH